MNGGINTDDIERIVKLITSTSDPDIKKILKDYLAWNLAAPLVTVGKEPGSIEYL